MTICHLVKVAIVHHTAYELWPLRIFKFKDSQSKGLYNSNEQLTGFLIKLRLVYSTVHT